MSLTLPGQALVQLWAGADMPVEALDRVVLTGAEPVLPSSFG